MSDLPPQPRTSRHWLEYTSTAVAVIVSVVSLWVAIGTEDANRKMVAAASWPSLQIDSSNSDAQNKPVMTFSVTNAGVGPARIRSFELFWKGKPATGWYDLVTRCCGFRASDNFSNVVPGQAAQGVITSAHVAKSVIRAGEERTFLSFPLQEVNRKTWARLDWARQHDIHFRICYCSVFDDCWIATYAFEGEQDQHPVDVCPVPKVGYVE